MDAFKDYFYLGKITKQHGFEGKVQIFLDTDEPEEYTNLDVVYLSIANKPVPFFIDDINIQGNKAIVKFSDVDNNEKAALTVNKDLYLPVSMLPELTGNKFYYHEAPGMLVIDKSFGEIGKVEKILEYPNQAVLQIFHDKDEVLIPIGNEIIKEFNRKKGIITTEVPEGLLDIYISKNN